MCVREKECKTAIAPLTANENSSLPMQLSLSPVALNCLLMFMIACTKLTTTVCDLTMSKAVNEW